VPIVLKSGSLNLLEPSGPVKVCNGIDLPFTSIQQTTERRFFMAKIVAVVFRFYKNITLTKFQALMPQLSGPYTE
jgi:hypothetical protein